MTRKTTLAAALAALVLCLAGPALAAAPIGAQAGTLDEALLRMNREVPGFGGLFHDAEGRVHVYLTETGDAALLERLGGDVQVHRGDYEFSDLYRWREALGALFARGDVVFLDVDETRNRVRVGVEAGRALATRSFDRELVRLRVPREAVEFVETDPIYELNHNVQHSFNPVPGGVEIGFSNFVCTLGFNVRFGDAGPCYFITNDHCSNVQGVTDGTQYFQPFGGVNIGQEVFDPPFFVGGACPVGFQCKFSDSTAAVYYNATMCEFARIARTFFNSIVINPATPRWFIVGKNYAPTANQRQIKQGRTTGLTAGALSGTCMNIQAAGTNIIRLCQNLVSSAATIVQGGDSGSPVFTLAPGSDQKVELAGILWGGNLPAGTTFVYSPIANVEADFGVLLPVGP